MGAAACGRIGYTRVSAGEDAGFDSPDSAGQRDAGVNDERTTIPGADSGRDSAPATLDTSSPPPDGVGPAPNDAAPPDRIADAGLVPTDTAPPRDGPTPPPDSGPMVDACSSCAPTTVRLESQSQTLKRGAGAPTYTDLCPSDEVIIGFEGFTSRNPMYSYMVGLGGVCGRVSFSSGSTAAAIVQTSKLPQRPGRDGVAWTRMCPSNQLVIGFAGRAGDWMNKFSFRCVPLLVSGSNGQYTASWGPVTVLPEVGANAGTEFPATDCQSGQVGRGAISGGSSWLDAFALVCATPRPSAF